MCQLAVQAVHAANDPYIFLAAVFQNKRLSCVHFVFSADIFDTSAILLYLIDQLVPINRLAYFFYLVGRSFETSNLLHRLCLAIKNVFLLKVPASPVRMFLVRPCSYIYYAVFAKILWF